MTSLLILKTGALGDVLRTTSILPGLRERYPGSRITWLTAPGAADLVRLHPLVTEVVTAEPAFQPSFEAARQRLALTTWERVISLDDEEPLCRLAASLPTKRLSGAFSRPSGERAYTPDTSPWFDMGLLSVHGKLVADRLKVENRLSHGELYAQMLGIPVGKPLLPKDPVAEGVAASFAARTGLLATRPVIGLNTGAGGRWQSKALPVERVCELARELHAALAGKVTFLLMGGPEEAGRNAKLLQTLQRGVRVVDAGTENSLLEFAALVSLCDLLLTSDSLALHMAVARDVRCVAFFAPTSAAEIDLYGLGEKVASTSADACSYRPDADTSTLTVERLAAAVMRNLPGSVA